MRKTLWSCLRTAGSGLAATVLPPLCPACVSMPCAAGRDLCESCRLRLPELATPRCGGCGGVLDNALTLCRECLSAEVRSWSLAVSVFPFAGTARELVHRFKYQGQTYLAALLAGRMHQAWVRHGEGTPDVVMPVPLHWFKALCRGYNQAELLADGLSAVAGVPVVRWLRRPRWTRQQARLDAAERRRNMRAAFRLTPTAAVRDKYVLLIDDVFTTGATLGAAAAVLRDAGAARIGVLTVARG